MSKLRALVVDDEPQMLSIVTFALETQGFECLSASRAAQAWNIVSKEHLDLIILDVMLPDTSGITLCERIRASYNVPIILLTALGEERDRLGGFYAGADDYVTKPFSPKELALRAVAIARRAQVKEQQDEWLTNGELRLNLESLEIFFKSQRLALTSVESRLLAALMRRSGQVVDTKTLLNEAWDTDSWRGGKEMVKTTMSRLRHKLQDAQVGGGEIITAVRGAGYVLAKL